MNSTIHCGDCIDILRTMPAGSVDLVLTDPPYNIGAKSTKNGKKIGYEWDKRNNYIDWCIEWINECGRILKPNGVLYLFHNDMRQIAQLITEIEHRTSLDFVSFCIWDKGDTFRAQSWRNRVPNGNTALRSWFNVCEYCLHFFNAPCNADSSWKKTGLDRIYSTPTCFMSIKQWYRSECERLGISDNDISKAYTDVTGKKPHMLRHYFKDSQFEIPTETVWNDVYKPLGFSREYEDLRSEYEDLRNVHHCDAMHCNIWHIPPIPSNKRYHTCQKPVEILRRLIRVSSNPGGIVLDCFTGSGSTGVACAHEGRDFIGIEIDPHLCDIAQKRIAEVTPDA